MTRAEAINWLINIMADIGKTQHRDLWNYEQALAEIKKMLEEEPQWIPCNERLPENYERVLTTISISNREPKVRSGYYHNGLFSNDNGDCWNSTDPEVKGWCELPEPYQPEREE